ncbi:hypothetical protein U472_14800 [Orenia metallireducens]|uniref:Porin domain-containing protein n=1 Tax=Orenia metallireducens TaxID=1413210 RepID=A0A1C0A672_9FIRM|nr:hypothetical protein [Orenia metallireducens]OCL25596.1 hypothetical protein U472_14800 [Orenia metallireducens]
MKKISLLLTIALVMALAVPAFAAEDNVKITGEVETVFEVGHYGEDADTTAELWADGDALDLDLADDSDDFPAERAFYQNIGLNIAGNVDNISFDLAVDTITNSFAKATRVPYDNNVELGENDDTEGLKFDTALLTISNEFATLKAGDLADYDVDSYFIDEEDMEGVEVSTAVADYAVKAFVVGEDGDKTDDYYGVSATKNFDNGSFTGKLYHVRAANKITDLAVAATVDVTDVFTVNGEVVFNSWENDITDDSDSLFNLGASYQATDIVTVRGEFETVGEKFAAAPQADLEENEGDYSKFNLGADFALNPNNTVKADYTVVDHADEAEKKNTFELALDNVNGAFTNTASVEFTTNNGYMEGTDITVFTLGTEYAMSDVTTLTAKLVNQSADDVSETYKDHNDYVKYTYLAAGLEQKISDNISWDTEAKYITGSNSADTQDGEGNSIKTKLIVSF